MRAEGVKMSKMPTYLATCFLICFHNGMILDSIPPHSSGKGGDDEAEGVSDMPLVQINIVRSIVAESTAMEVRLVEAMEGRRVFALPDA